MTPAPTATPAPTVIPLVADDSTIRTAVAAWLADRAAAEATYKHGVAELPNRADHTEYMTMLSNRSGGLDGLYH